MVLISYTFPQLPLRVVLSLRGCRWPCRGLAECRAGQILRLGLVQLYSRLVEGTQQNRHLLISAVMSDPSAKVLKQVSKMNTS